jgi:hypothetical protein
MESVLTSRSGVVSAKFLSEGLKGKDYLEGVGVDGRIILKRILKNDGFIWLRTGPSGRLL